MAFEYDYRVAFDRNIGIVTEAEQEKLSGFTIAIPGMGAAGSAYLISMVRQGFQRFRIADFDRYELVNFNRQYGATIDSIGKLKAEVMKAKALEINPLCEISTFDDGINENNVDRFLEGASIVMDGLDFFEIGTRRMIFNRALSRSIPVITCAPLGFGMSCLVFLPGGRNFDQYFGVDDATPNEEMLIRFALNLTPDMLHRTYMTGTRLGARSVSSSMAGIHLATSVGVVNAIKVLLRKGRVKPVPYCHQYDSMVDRYICRKVSMWHGNPVKRLKIRIAKKMFFGDAATREMSENPGRQGAS